MMDTEQIVKELLEIKKQVTALGHTQLSGKIPIAIDDAVVLLTPFANIEKCFDKEIAKLKKQK